jgi:hypothetical protein
MDGKEPEEKSRILPTRIVQRGSCSLQGDAPVAVEKRA